MSRIATLASPLSESITQSTMTDLDLLQNAEFKEAFDEFDKVS